MKRNTLTIITCASLFSFQAAPTHAMDIINIEISKAGDLEMHCGEISKEISFMENIIYSAQETQDNSQITITSVSVAKTVGSYLVGSLGGALGILAAGYLVSEATENKTESAIALQDTAKQRRSFMNGVYNARGCKGPLIMASIEPAAGKEGTQLAPPPRKPHYNN